MHFFYKKSLKRTASAQTHNNAAKYRGAPKWVSVGLMALTLSSCTSIGVRSIETQRGSYIEALARTDRQELIANIVRVKYTEPPVFLQVSSITASPSLEYGVNGEGRGSFGDFVPPSGSLAPRLVYKDDPVISYAPFTGKQFANEFLVPIGPTAIFLMLDNGFDFSVVAQLMFVSVNGLQNGRDASPTDREKFRTVAAAMGELLRSGYAQIGLSGKPDSEGERDIVIDITPGARQTPEGQRVFSEWNLSPNVRRIKLRVGLGGGGDTLAVRTRSLLSMLSYLANYVDTPDDHQNKVWRASVGGSESWPLRIRTSDDEPDDAYTAIQHKGHWFYVEAEDVPSHNVLYLLRVLFNLQAQANTGESAGPQLTLPVQ